MTHNQFRKANSLILTVLTTILLLSLLLLVVGCVTEKETYRTVYFADTNGVDTVIYYPVSMEKDLRNPHDDERWKYVAAKDASDDGKAKQMRIKP